MHTLCKQRLVWQWARRLFYSCLMKNEEAGLVLANENDLTLCKSDEYLMLEFIKFLQASS